MKKIILPKLLLIFALVISFNEIYAQIGMWTSLNDLPSERGFSASVVFDNKIYIFGGFPDSDEPAITEVIAYDPIADSFIIGLANLPVPLGRHKAEVINDKIYILGGHSTNFGHNMVKSVYEYDPHLNTWIQKADMLQPRFNHSTAVLNDKLIAVAGRTVTYPAEVDVSAEMYDPVADSWTFLPSMNNYRAGHESEVIDGKLYVLGGSAVDGSIPGIEVYDPMTNQWTLVDDSFIRWGLGSVVLDGHIYFFGGGNYTTGLMGTWKYDVSEDTLIDLQTPLPEALAYSAHGLLDDGLGNKCIYVLGGTTADWWNGGSGSHTTATVLQYCPDRSTVYILGEEAISALEFNIFPNPTFDQIQIYYQLPNSTNVTIDMFDEMGQMVHSVAYQSQASGNYDFILDVENLSTGIYYCKIKTDKYIGTKKFTIQH